MKKLINIYLFTILVLVSCSKNDAPEPAKENVVNSPFKVKYEIITDNNVIRVNGWSNSFSITYSIEQNGILYLNKFESFSTKDGFPTKWTKEFTATSTSRPYTLNLSATIPLTHTGRQYIIGNIYVNDALVATQKGELRASTNESTIDFAWAVQ